MLQRINNQLRTALLASGNLVPAPTAATFQAFNKRAIAESQAAAIGARRAELQRKPTISTVSSK